jgi:SAM-dependent methyltransferase
MTTDLVELLFEAYPFIEIDAASERALVELHTRLVVELVNHLSGSGSWAETCGEVMAARAAHFDRLQRLLAEVLGPHQREAIRTSTPPLVSSDYSPPLQLRVFGVEEGALRDPILDLGCGRHALLVEWLRRRHHEVTGVDRVADPSDDCLRASWFDVPLEPGRYGSIFSHLAFSLHFLHAHLRPARAAERFARKYMEILRALRPGGTFYYAPGLPFIEPHLDPRRHEVRRNPVPESQLLDMPEPLQAVYLSEGSEGMYASAVRRLY